MSTPVAGAKLTKKQQKALKHRTGVRKGKGKANEQEVEQDEVPEQDLLDDEVGLAATTSNKRKRSDADDRVAQDQNEGESSAEDANKVVSKTAKRRLQRQKAAQTKKENDSQKRRFIVFVGASNVSLMRRFVLCSTMSTGNLPYKCTSEDIVNHFREACGKSIHAFQFNSYSA